MTYRNFRTANTGLGNLALTILMAAVGVIGLTDPNVMISAAGREAASEQATPTPEPTVIGERARLRAIPERHEETSRVVSPRNLTAEPRAVQGLHHGRDDETPSTLVERGPAAVRPEANPHERFENDLGGIPLLPDAGIVDEE